MATWRPLGKKKSGVTQYAIFCAVSSIQTYLNLLGHLLERPYHWTNPIVLRQRNIHCPHWSVKKSVHPLPMLAHEQGAVVPTLLGARQWTYDPQWDQWWKNGVFLWTRGLDLFGGTDRSERSYRGQPHFFGSLRSGPKKSTWKMEPLSLPKYFDTFDWGAYPW